MQQTLFALLVISLHLTPRKPHEANYIIGLVVPGYQVLVRRTLFALLVISFHLTPAKYHEHNSIIGLLVPAYQVLMVLLLWFFECTAPSYEFKTIIFSGVDSLETNPLATSLSIIMSTAFVYPPAR